MRASERHASLPLGHAARDAVLEYFSMVFHEALNVAVQPDFESDVASSPSLEAVSMIGPDLCALGESWAPFVAPWCISLLKDIATNKSNFSNSTLQNSDPIRVLLDIATQNLTLLKADERAKCIDMLLGCSQCDWVIGHLGRVEPSLVVPRALQLGLESPQHGIEHAVAIVSHLPPTHSQHIREALTYMFHEALKDDNKMDKKRDIIPYLLSLASKSDTVLKALTQNIEEILTDGVVERLIQISPLMRNIPSWEGVGPSSLVALLIRADIKTFMLLLRHAKRNIFCRQLLEYLLQKLEYECLFPEKKIPLLSSAADDIGMVREAVLTGNQLQQYSLARILVLVNINLDSERFQNFINMGVENALRDSMKSDLMIKDCFIGGSPPEDQKTYLHHFCLNMVKLLRWENSNKVSHLRNRPISKACEANLFKLGCAFNDTISLLRVTKPCTMSSLPEMPTCHAIADMLDRVDMSGAKAPPPSVEAVMKVVQASVKYFFRCLHEKDDLTKIQGTQTACRLLRKLCLHSKLARAIALRELLETAMFREEEVFGSKPVLAAQGAQEWGKDDLLIHLNQKHGPITQLTQSHTSVFHAGIIGKGVRKEASTDTDSIPLILTTNIELLMGALMSCMDGNGGTVEGMTSVSLLLVELVSPDVMYNGLPWPDEDFTKQVSIERELYMRGALEGCAVARAALRRAASCRPALCYASALLRAVAATLLHRHRAADDRYTRPSDMRREQVAMGELLETMTLGQLLPHPLHHMSELMSNLTASEDSIGGTHRLASHQQHTQIH
ncbi:Integrator complex subunit 5 [Eumeta japonica]|uniref:Integrator complex subunit 5 n=1 Tax=Eumeta variegata TaxID=151549 RepID=A0A4C1W6B1_EUMVA|nr:Integrator complex subunit 5 [Eumeta japonica]